MIRAVVVLPGLVTPDSEVDVLRESQRLLEPLSATGVVERISSVPNAWVPEAAWLGVDPLRVPVPQGPLTVSALKVDPPERSVHFHLNLGTLSEEGLVQEVGEAPSAVDIEVLKGLVQRLDTSALKSVWGWGTDHALVWERGSIELGTVPYADVVGKSVVGSLPEGDGESILRRYIDDSVNLLQDIELNRRRNGEGLQPWNILWPWGQGFRPNVPNLAVRRGEVAQVESRSLRLAGLSRLVGYRHGDLTKFGRRLLPDWTRLSHIAETHQPTVTLIESIEQATRARRWDEACAMFKTMMDSFVSPLLSKRPFRLALFAPGLSGQTGLLLRYDSEVKQENRVPFDLRVVEDSKVTVRPDWEAVESALRP